MADKPDAAGSEAESAQRPQFCPHCGKSAGSGAFCPSCGSQLTDADASNGGSEASDSAPAAVDIRSAKPKMNAASVAGADFDVPAGAPFGDSIQGSAKQWPATIATPPHSSRAWLIVAGVGAVAITAAAVAVILVVSGGSSNASAQRAYRQKLGTAFAPVLTANTALSSALSSLSGKNITAAKSALATAQSATSGAQAASSVLTVPPGSGQLAQHVQLALTQENGYLLAVQSAFSSPSSADSSQLQQLATSTQTAFVNIASAVPNGSQSISGTVALTSWISAQVAARSHAQDVAQAKNVKSAAEAALKAAGLTPSDVGTSSDPYATGRACGGGLYAGPNTSCPFAMNVENDYYQAGGNGVLSVDAYSPVTGRYYVMYCTPAGDGTTCSGGIDASLSW
jgi:hypothetical protein